MDLVKFIILFKENDIDLDLLMNLIEMRLMGLLIDIKLIYGNWYKIVYKIEIIKVLGKYFVCMVFKKNKIIKVKFFVDYIFWIKVFKSIVNNFKIIIFIINLFIMYLYLNKYKMWKIELKGFIWKFCYCYDRYVRYVLKY